MKQEIEAVPLSRKEARELQLSVFKSADQLKGLLRHSKKEGDQETIMAIKNLMEKVQVYAMFIEESASPGSAKRLGDQSHHVMMIEQIKAHCHSIDQAHQSCH